MASPFGTLFYVQETKYKAEKALVAAKFNGIKLSERVVTPEEPLKAEFLAKNPTGKAPFLETDMGVIFTSNAVARYIARCRADTDLYGRSFEDECHIDTWLEFSTYELEVPLMTWVYPCLGLMPDNEEASRLSKEDVKKALAALEERLKGSQYLIGDFISLADIVVLCVIRMGFAHVFDPAFRKGYTKVCEWFERCTKLPQIHVVLGDVKLCTAAAKPKAVLPAFTEAGASPARKAEPKAKAVPQAKAEPKATAKAASKAAAAPAPAPAQTPALAPSGDVEAQVKAKGDEIRVLKDKLKAEGLSGKKINTHEEVVRLVAELTALKEGVATAPAAASSPAATPAVPAAPAAPAAAQAGGGDLDAAIKAKGDEIRILKDKLKAEGVSGKKLNNHEEIARLVGELNALKDGAPPAAPAASAPAAPAGEAPAPAAPAAPAGSDAEAQIKAKGDEIRVLKDKLKAEGLSGKKINNHEEVARLVAELTELKKLMG